MFNLKIASVGQDVEKREPSGTVGSTVIGAATVENCAVVPQKIKNSTTIRSSNATFGHISEGNKITIVKKYLYISVHCSIIHNSQDMEKCKCPWMGEWRKKMWCIPIVEYYSATKRKTSPALCSGRIVANEVCLRCDYC